MDRLSRADYRGLLDLSSQGKRRERGLLLVPGIKCVREVLLSDWSVRQLLFTEAGADSIAQALPERCTTDAPMLVRDSEAAKLAGQSTAEGVIALVERPPSVFEGAWEDPSAPQLLLDGLSDPGNLGAILRSAAWFGVTRIARRGGCAPDSPRAVRSSMGTLFRMRRLAGIEDPDLERLSAKRRLVLLDGEGDESLESFRFHEGDMLALGSESHGSSLPGNWALVRLAIPGGAGVESLNVGHAFAMAAWERVRQLGPWA